MAETVLVTGGTGFVAGWCIVELLQRGYAVCATVRSLSKEKAVRAAITKGCDAGDRLSFAVADLTKDEGWDAAVLGCDYVLHIASPLGNDAPRDPDALILPAREGTLRVLRAATKAGVKRVVMTSSCAAATPLETRKDTSSDETIWTDPNDKNTNAYRLSKIAAERAAWDFMTQHAGSTSFAAILPAAIFGPVLTKENLGSVGIIQRLLSGAMPGLPRMGFNVVDVRDLADLHIRAMTAPEAAGQRFIAAHDFMWMKDVAAALKSNLGPKAAKVPTRNMPDWLVRFLAVFVPQLRQITPIIGRRHSFSSAKAQRLLGFAPRPGTTTIVDCAESLVGEA